MEAAPTSGTKGGGNGERGAGLGYSSTAAGTNGGVAKVSELAYLPLSLRAAQKHTPQSIRIVKFVDMWSSPEMKWVQYSVKCKLTFPLYESLIYTISRSPLLPSSLSTDTPWKRCRLSWLCKARFVCGCLTSHAWSHVVVLYPSQLNTRKKTREIKFKNLV